MVQLRIPFASFLEILCVSEDSSEVDASVKATLRDVFGGHLAAHDCGVYVASFVWQPEVLWTEVRMEREFKVKMKKIFYDVCVCVLSRSVMSQPVTLWTAAHQTHLCPWNFSGVNTRVGCYFLLQGIFPT